MGMQILVLEVSLALAEVLTCSLERIIAFVTTRQCFLESRISSLQLPNASLTKFFAIKTSLTAKLPGGAIENKLAF